MAKIGWKTKEQIKQEVQANKYPLELLIEEVETLKKRVEALEIKNA